MNTQAIRQRMNIRQLQGQITTLFEVVALGLILYYLFFLYVYFLATITKKNPPVSTTVSASQQNIQFGTFDTVFEQHQFIQSQARAANVENSRNPFE